MKIKDYYNEPQYIHYSNCHEDAAFVISHINNSPKKILSIASALDNALAMLLLDPNEILAIDSNDTQIYLCNLKKCGIKYLEYEQFTVLIGLEDGDSKKYYEQIKPYLDEETARYFDEHIYLITDTKLIHCGRFEYYFSIFKNKVLPLIHTKKTIAAFMNAEDIGAQNEIYDKSFNNIPFKLMFKLFFSQAVMQKLGRDKDYFKYNKGSLSSLLKSKFETCIKNNLNASNPYLQYILFNRFCTLPLYLKRENFDIIKKNIDKLTVKKADFFSEISGHKKYDLMYLSDIFEYMSEDVMDFATKEICGSLNDGGLVLLFNMMNQRRLGAPLSETKLDQTHNHTFYYTECYLYSKK